MFYVLHSVSSFGISTTNQYKAGGACSEWLFRSFGFAHRRWVNADSLYGQVIKYHCKAASCLQDLQQDGLFHVSRVSAFTASTPLPLPTRSICWSIMVPHCLACISSLVRRGCFREALPGPQHLPDSHIHSGALDVPGAHHPVLLCHRLHHSAVLQG